jgi:hypothetical protein
MLKATVSGSFHRHMEAISAAVQELMAHSVRVLSPADPRVVAAQGEFLFVASDRVRSVRLVQDRHLESIRSADFLWLVCPDGYVGQSASMEIGFACGAGIPIFSTRLPADLTLREYVSIVSSIEDAIQTVEIRPRRNRPEGLLIDPHASIEEAHASLEKLRTAFSPALSGANAATLVRREISKLDANLMLPTRVH